LRYMPVQIAAPPPQDPALSYAPKKITGQYFNYDI